MLLLVVDGLRPDYVRPDWMPRLDSLATAGVRGRDHHAVFPTVTRVNGPAIFTGRYPGGSGALGNSMYLPEVDSTRVLDAGDVRDLWRIRDASDGALLTAPSLGEILADHGRVLFAASSGSTGSGSLMNHTGAGAGIVHHAITIPDSLGAVVAEVLGPVPEVPEGEPAIALVARVVDAVLEIGLDQAEADVLAAWLTEPDGTAHATGTGSPETVAVLRAVDAEIGRLLDGLETRGLLASTTILVTSDHGFSTRTGQVDLEELLVEAGLKASESSMDVVIAGDAIHVRAGGPPRRDSIVRLLQRTPWIGPVFTPPTSPDSPEGLLEGTLAFGVVGWDHPRAGDILTSGNWTDAANEWGFPGEVTTPGVAGHGSSSPWDIRGTFVAAGSRVRRGVELATPTGNIDLTPTVLHLVGVTGVPDFDGRVLAEVFDGGPLRVQTAVDSVVAEAHLGDLVYRLVVHRRRVGGTTYFSGTRVDRLPPSSYSGSRQ